MPQAIADNAFIILEGLGLLSSEYGFMDYLRGHYPDSTNHKDQTYVIKLPITKVTNMLTQNDKNEGDKEEDNEMGIGKEKDKENGSENEDANANEKESKDDEVNDVNDSYRNGNRNDKEIILNIPTGGKLLEILKNEHKNGNITMNPEKKIQEIFLNLGKNVPKDQELVFLSVLRSIDGLKNTNSQEDRFRIISIRVQCLLIMSHSRLVNEHLYQYLKLGSIVLKDLISLSDLSSESYAELELLQEHSSSFLSTIITIMKCTYGLTEFYLKEKGSLLDGILHELGLSKSGKIVIILFIIIIIVVVVIIVLLVLVVVDLIIVIISIVVIIIVVVIAVVTASASTTARGAVTTAVVIVVIIIIVIVATATV